MPEGRRDRRKIGLTIVPDWLTSGVRSEFKNYGTRISQHYILGSAFAVHIDRQGKRGHLWHKKIATDDDQGSADDRSAELKTTTQETTFVSR